MKKKPVYVVEINTREDLRRFVDFPLRSMARILIGLPIIEEEIDTLDQSKNPVFKNAKAHYFLAFKDGEIAGRIFW